MQHQNAFEATRAVDYKRIKVNSPEFEQNGIIPELYTCDGENRNPPLELQDIPEETKCLAIIVEDPDAPKGIFIHWVAWNIPVMHHIREGHSAGAQGMNDFGKHRYDGPCPPSGTHRYYFKVYALDSTLDIPVSSDKSQLESAMSEHIIGFGELMGKYGRSRSI
ncbi:MAG: YbhB/YbcL family Raf kinase inhibitor-like protein [Sphingobacteriales bacterium]